MPKKAGNRSLRKFIMALNIPATAPGFVTRSLRLGTLNLKAAFPAASADLADCSPGLSAAAASSSGAMDSVILDGSDSMSFWRNGGRCL